MLNLHTTCDGVITALQNTQACVTSVLAAALQPLLVVRPDSQGGIPATSMG